MSIIGLVHNPPKLSSGTIVDLPVNLIGNTNHLNTSYQIEKESEKFITKVTLDKQFNTSKSNVLLTIFDRCKLIETDLKKKLTKGHKTKNYKIFKIKNDYYFGFNLLGFYHTYKVEL